MFLLVVRDNMCDRDSPHIVQKGEDRQELQELAWIYEEQADNFERYSVMTEEDYFDEINGEYFNMEDWEYEEYKHVYEYGLEKFEDYPVRSKR